MDNKLTITIPNTVTNLFVKTLFPNIRGDSPEKYLILIIF